MYDILRAVSAVALSASERKGVNEGGQKLACKGEREVCEKANRRWREGKGKTANCTKLFLRGSAGVSLRKAACLNSWLPCPQLFELILTIINRGILRTYSSTYRLSTISKYTLDLPPCFCVVKRIRQFARITCRAAEAKGCK